MNSCNLSWQWLQQWWIMFTSSSPCTSFVWRVGNLLAQLTVTFGIQDTPRRSVRWRAGGVSRGGDGGEGGGDAGVVAVACFLFFESVSMFRSSESREVVRGVNAQAVPEAGVWWRQEEGEVWQSGGKQRVSASWSSTMTGISMRMMSTSELL